jgi:hypothetical protein
MEWRHLEVIGGIFFGALAGLGWGINLGRRLYHRETWHAIARAFRFLQDNDTASKKEKPNEREPLN